MDKKLLDALNNLSESLDLIAQVLSEKDGAQSPTAKALESGDFVNQIKEINEGVKKIQADNQKIIKNQETILALSKKKETEKKTGAFQTAGDKDTQKLIKSGVSIVLIIAAGVLAIGMAFKLVGKVDFLSVVGLSLAMVLVAVAFEKIAKLNLSRKEALNTSLVMVIMSAGLTASSWILSLIRPIGFNQVVTGTLIGIMFAAMSSSLENIFVATILFDKLKVSPVKLLISLVSISASITASSWILSLIKPINFGQAMTAILISVMLSVISYNLHKIGAGVVAFEKTGVKPLSLVKVLLGIATAITVSSWILSMTKPISFGQAITAILIAAMFAVVSFNLEKIAAGVIAFEKTKVKATSLLMVLVGIATAITASSWILSMTKPISLPQALTIILIAVIFAAMSYIMPELAIGIMIIDKYVGKSKIWLVPLMFIAISIAIMASSWVLSKTTPVPFMTLLNILIMSVVLAISAVVLGIAAGILSKIGLKNILLGSVAIILIAGTVMVSSWLLNEGTYDNYPGLDWGLGVILSIGSFAVLAGVIGFIAMSGIGFVAMLLGLGTMIMIAATISEISNILSDGNFSYGKDLFPWAKGVSLLYMTFTPIMMFLGAMGIVGSIMSFFGGPDPFEMAKNMMIQIAETIKEVSITLAGGNYKDGPTIDWAYGVSRAIAAFSYVYFKLQEGQSFLSILTGGNAVEDFTNAIYMISDGIVHAGRIFADAGVTVWKGGPPEEWAKGVGLAIGAFAPVYKVVSDKSLLDSILGTDVGAEVKQAMVTVAEGIVEVAKYFNKNKVPFSGNYPTKAWGEGVGAAMKGFGEVYNLLYDAGWDSDDLEEWRPSIFHILTDIGMAAARFTLYKKMGLSWIFPDPKGTKGLKGSIQNMVDLYQYLYDYGWDPDYVEEYGVSVWNMTVDMIDLAKLINRNKNIWGTKIDPNFMKNLTSNVISYVALAKFVNGNLPSAKGGLTGAISGMLFGEESTQNPMDRVIDGMVRLGMAYNMLSKSIKNFGNSINGIDAEKLSTIRAFTSNVILMSFMDPEAFEEMLDKLEEKAGVFTDIISDMNSAAEQGNKKSATGVKTGTTTTSKTDQTQQQMLQILSAMDAKLGTIARNSSTLADYTNELRTGQGVKIKK